MGRDVQRKKPSKSTSGKAELSVVTQAAEYFQTQINKALEHQKVKVSPITEHYLVDLLSRFMLSDNFFVTEKDGARREEVLALLMGEALAKADAASRQRGLRRLGDVSLYTAGFFSDRLSKKVVDVDYYIGMGRSAYVSLAAMGPDLYFQTVFAELAERFHKFVDVFGEVSEAAGCTDAKNILRLYENWLKTRSERAEKSLKEAGIIPNKLVKPDWQ